MEVKDFKNIQPALYVATLIVSIVGLVLVLVDGIGGWYTGAYSWSYYFHISAEMSAPWAQIVHILISLGLIFIAFIALQKLYPILSLDKDLEIKLLNLSFYVAISVSIFTLFSGIVFAIIVSDAMEWWFDSGFYAGIVSGGLVALFLKISMKTEEE
ncbi:MAG: hypothetical protein ACTSPI_05935 [Candidatus Heimdallarchaeaceae archaeon]